MLKKIDVVTLALIDSDGRILLCKRNKDKLMGGLWEFPGGKIEKNETPEVALIREINEELSINIEKSCIAPLTFSTQKYNSEIYLILLYVCRVWDGNINSKEYDEIKWVEKRDLRGYAMPEANKNLVAIIDDYL